MNPIVPGATIGIIGGGQLGRMMALEAKRMGYRIPVLDPDERGLDAAATSDGDRALRCSGWRRREWNPRRIDRIALVSGAWHYPGWRAPGVKAPTVALDTPSPPIYAADFSSSAETPSGSSGETVCAMRAESANGSRSSASGRACCRIRCTAKRAMAACTTEV